MPETNTGQSSSDISYEDAKRRWDEVMNMPNCEEGEVILVLRDYLVNNFSISPRLSVKRLFDVAYEDLDHEEFEDLLEYTEKGVTERKKLINQFKRRFEEENKNGIIQRYIKHVLIPNLDAEAITSSYEDVVTRACHYLSEGDLSFLETLGLDQAIAINREFEELLKNIDLKEIEVKEEEERKEKDRERKVQKKIEKKSIVAMLAYELENKKKVLQAMINFLNIRGGVNVMNVGYGKKFSSFLDGFNIDELKQIADLYSEIIKITRKLGGNIREKDDLLIGFEELVESKKAA